MLRTLLRAVMVATVFATLLVPAPATAVGDVSSYTLQTTSKPFKKGVETYQLSLYAHQYADGSEFMEVSIWQVSDPEGVAWARQEQRYTWMNLANRFVPSAPNNTSTLKSATEMGSYGSVAVTLKKNSTEPGLACGGTVKKWPGTLTGTVTLNTGTTTFGTVNAVPAGGTLFYNDGTRCSRLNVPYNACPVAGMTVSAGRSGAVAGEYSNFFAQRPADSTKPANLAVKHSTPFPDAKTNAPGYLDRMVETKAPRTDVVIAPDLSSGTVKGEAGTWVSGSATFTQNSSAYGTGTSPCAGGMARTGSNRPGTMSGTLAADMFDGPNVVLGQNAYGAAIKTVVQPYE